MKLTHVRWRATAIVVCMLFLLTVTALSIVTADSAEVPAAQDVAAPIPYPDPNDIGIGGLEVNRQPMSEIVAYMSLPEYHQAPVLDQFVESGALPPVEERLPVEPAVMLTSGMKDGVGVYGDLFRGFSACPTAGYNRMAGVSMGWFGIESYTVDYGALVKTGPMFRVDQDIEPMPNIAKSWEWSEDGKQLTMHLVEGVKWSDGVPFTADDVMFTWDGYIQDENIAGPRSADSWSWNGEFATLEAVDDYTIMFTFPVERPYDAFYLMDEGDFDIMPAHQLRPLHPRWSEADPKPSYADFKDILPPDKLPLVTLGPWVVTEYQTDELMIMRRNPYYWKVDEAGNQLPYFDEIQYRKGPSGIGRDLCTIAGDCDHMNLENPSTFVQAMTEAQKEDAPFEVSWGPELLGYGIEFNFAINFGIEGDRDVAVRELFRDLRFRQAVSYATDRDGVAQSVMRGPFLRGWAGGLYPGAPDFDRESVVYYPYDPASANALLDDMGLIDNDGDGVREWTEGPMAGEPVVVQLLASQDAKETQSVAEAVVNQWGEIGIQVNMRIIDSATNSEVSNAGTWDMRAFRGGQNFALPFTNPTSLAPMTNSFNWHRQSPDTPRELMDFEQQLIDIMTEYRATFDPEARKALMFEYNQIFTENAYNVGVFIGRYGLGLSKRVNNVADGLPVFLYQWVENAILLDTLWTPVDQQLPQNRPDTIAVYE